MAADIFAKFRAGLTDLGLAAQHTAAVMEGFNQGLRTAGITAARMARLARLTPAERLALDRGLIAGNGSEAHDWPDQWQSAVCSAWLHESCVSDAFGLGCHCTCHTT